MKREENGIRKLFLPGFLLIACTTGFRETTPPRQPPGQELLEEIRKATSIACYRTRPWARGLMFSPEIQRKEKEEKTV